MNEKKILVVDFDEESLISLSNLVFEEGFQAVTAMDGLSGFEKYKAEDFDLVIIEPMLPKLHGFELMKRINQDPARRTPIIVVTGIYREPSSKAEAIEVYGASGYFTKPWNKDDLRSTMLQLLVNGKEEHGEKQETVIPAPAEKSSSQPAEDWGLLKTELAAREPRAVLSLNDIEKELEAAVSGLAGTHGKNDAVTDARKEKRESKASIDGEIDALLKGAIGSLGIEKKKKKSEAPRPEVKRPSPPPPPRVEPAAPPTPSYMPEPIIDIFEKKKEISVAKEIKERIPPRPRTEDKIPPPPARVHFEAKKPSRGIDQTLVEIDKIPLDFGKDAGEKGRPVLEQKKVEPVEKKAYFVDYPEPAKTKSPVALVGGLAAAILILAGSTFIIFKPKKPQEPAGQMVSSLQPSLPSEFREKQSDLQAASINQESESETPPMSESKPPPQSKPNPPPEKKTAATASQPEAVETSVPIAPVLPDETPPLGMELQSDPGIGSSASDPQPAALQANASVQQEPSRQTEPPPAKPKAKEPTRVLAQPGELVDIENVDVTPVLLKKIDPRYPLQALNMGVGGTVTVNALISETGDVIRTEILKGIKGNYGLERAAETAIRQWQFKPAEKDGVPVRVWKPLDIIFKPTPSQNQ